MPENAPRTPRAELPEFLRSPMMGQLVAAHLDELANQNERNGARGEDGAVHQQSATQRAEVAMLRQAGREITDYHAARNGGAR